MKTDGHSFAPPSILYLNLDCSSCSTHVNNSEKTPFPQSKYCKARTTSYELKTILGGDLYSEIVLSGIGWSFCPNAMAFIEVARKSSIALTFDVTYPRPVSIPKEYLYYGDTVIVQLDSATPNTHDELYHSPGLYADTIALIYYVSNERSKSGKKPLVVVKTAVRFENYRDLLELAEKIFEIGCKDWLWDFATGRPYSFLTDTQARELYDELPALEHYCKTKGIAVRTPLTADGVPDLRVLGTSMNEIAASCIGVFPSNANCRVVTDVAFLDLLDLTLAACPILARRAQASPKISLSREESAVQVTQAWADPAFVRARRQRSLLTREICTNCTPALRRLHQDIIRIASIQSTQKTSASQTTIQCEDYCNVTLRPIEAGGILLNYRCDAACQHCLYASDSRTRLPITRIAMKEIISTLAKVTKGPRGLHISGGEPFLDLTLLKQTIREMIDSGLRLEFVETNGSWGSKPTARSMLRDLRSCGLERIRFSASPFHQPFIKRSTLQKAIDLAREILGEESVYVLDRMSIEMCVDVPIPFDLVPGGRAGYFMTKSDDGMPASDFNEGCSAELLNSGHAHFDAEGNVTPGVCTGISICKVRDLPGAYSELRLTPMIQGLISDGPASLWRLAELHFGYEELKCGYAGKCHLCVDVRLHLVRKAASSFPELAPLVFYEGVERYRHIMLRGDIKTDSIRWDSAASRSQL